MLKVIPTKINNLLVLKSFSPANQKVLYVFYFFYRSWKTLGFLSTIKLESIRFFFNFERFIYVSLETTESWVVWLIENSVWYVPSTFDQKYKFQVGEMAKLPSQIAARNPSNLFLFFFRIGITMKDEEMRVCWMIFVEKLL